jgi:hypothetical protein
MRFSSPITAAGPRWILTTFPFHLLQNTFGPEQKPQIAKYLIFNTGSYDGPLAALYNLLRRAGQHGSNRGAAAAEFTGVPHRRLGYQTSQRLRSE